MNDAYTYDSEKRVIRGPGLVAEMEVVESDADALEFIKALNTAYTFGFAAGEENERKRALAGSGGAG